MATATLTKAQLEAVNAELEARVSELEQQLAGTEQTQRDQLVQRVWLQRQMPTNTPERQVTGHTREGDLWMAFGAQYSSKDRTSGQRYYGAYKNLLAFGEVAEAAKAIFETGNRLVEIHAYERPQRAEGSGPRRSDWVITSIAPVGETLPPAPAPAPAPKPQAPVEPAFAGEPSSEEVPF